MSSLLVGNGVVGVVAGCASPDAVEGEATLSSRSAASSLVKLYGSWRCPHSQRVWIGLEEKGVEYQWIEVDLQGPGQGRSRSRLPIGEIREKFPEFFACSPRGTLPALDNAGERVFDSLIIAEYAHEAFSGPPLMPVTPLARARVRLWTGHVDRRIVPNFDRLLGASDSVERARARSDLLEGLAEWEAAMAPESEGPFFLGDDFSLADIALAPWWQRMRSVLRAYRSFDPTTMPRMMVWYEALMARPSFRRTVVDAERLIEEYADCCADTTMSSPEDDGHFFVRRR